MDEGVLHQRLENKARHQGALEPRLDREAGAEAVGEAHLLDRQVALEESDLLGERDLVGTIGVEHLTEHLAELLQHPRGGRGVPVPHQDGDGVQAVEEKVRVELRPERPEPRLGELGGEPGGVDRALAGFGEVERGVLDAQHREVDRDAEGQRRQGPADHRLGRRGPHRLEAEHRAEEKARAGP